MEKLSLIENSCGCGEISHTQILEEETYERLMNDGHLEEVWSDSVFKVTVKVAKRIMGGRPYAVQMSRVAEHTDAGICLKVKAFLHLLNWSEAEVNESFLNKGETGEKFENLTRGFEQLGPFVARRTK